MKEITKHHVLAELANIKETHKWAQMRLFVNGAISRETYNRRLAIFARIEELLQELPVDAYKQQYSQLELQCKGCMGPCGRCEE